MRSSISYFALAIALSGGAGAANAQTVTTRDLFDPAAETVVTQPALQSVRTTETTVRTVRPAEPARTARSAHVVRPVHPARAPVHGEAFRPEVVTTRRTVVNERVIPTTTTAVPAIAGTTVATYPQPLYAAPAPLYDEVAPAPVGVAAPSLIGTSIPTYRYVYEPDRILVIDPATNIAIQAIPR